MNVENILNTEWDEAQFATDTRLKGEKAGITELCYTPGNPRNIQMGISYKF
jgi:outer membrane receptor protein involved in Fe transport